MNVTNIEDASNDKRKLADAEKLKDALQMIDGNYGDSESDKILFNQDDKINTNVSCNNSMNETDYEDEYNMHITETRTNRYSTFNNSDSDSDSDRDIAEVIVVDHNSDELSTKFSTPTLLKSKINKVAQTRSLFANYFASSNSSQSSYYTERNADKEKKSRKILNSYEKYSKRWNNYLADANNKWMDQSFDAQQTFINSGRIR